MQGQPAQPAGAARNLTKILVQLKHELSVLLDSSDGLESLWGMKLTQTSDAAEEERQRTLLSAFLASANGDADAEW